MLLLAAGRGTRFGGALPKAFLQLGGRPLLCVAAERLVAALPPDAEGELVVLVHPDDRRHHLGSCLAALHALPLAGRLRIVDGGDSRQQSMQRGLAACADDTDLVLVHDAARALLPRAATRRCIAAAAQHGAALLAVPTPDTLKRVANDNVVATLDRAGVWQAQTPQVVRRELLVRAMAHAAATGFQGADDVSLVEHLGATVVVVAGSPTNLKITRPEDLPLANAILAADIA
jgi:2-C-methyl-D-erythritol 4-phosphate cytidylyltransferase